MPASTDIDADRHPENVDGDWFVDRRCIGCGTSYSVAPELFTYTADGKFVFARQPDGPAETHRARLAAELCPTRSVRTVSRQHWSPYHPMHITEGVWRCGHNSPDAVGANSYLVQRPDGNILVDGPRWNRALAGRLAELGGVRHVLLTHRDDIGDAERYAAHFGADTAIHEADAEFAPFATRQLTGEDPIELAAGAIVLPTPGHTVGHVMLLVGTVLFTGDSLAWEPHRESLWAEESVCWDSWPQQLDSLRRLLDHDFTLVVPGHGALSPELPAGRMREHLTDLLAELG